MATVLQLQFPGRRYHATPWGYHVNEGLVEWPPSPWRILRALLATGFNKASWSQDGPPAEARRLLERLAAELPSYHLPEVSLGHSRHYVDAANKKPLIIDTWARLESGSCVEVGWELDLSGGERLVLEELVTLLGYLGRSESWVEAKLASAFSAPPNCFPANADDREDAGNEIHRVLCTQSADEYRSWLEANATPSVNGKTGKGRKASAAPQPRYPVDLIAALCVETGSLQSEGWSSAPGTKQVVYWRRADALQTAPTKRRHLPKVESVTMALLALSTPSRNRSALPTLARVFPQGRLLHKALASSVGRLGGAAALTLLGRNRTEVAQDHGHAHLLHLDLDGDERLDHALIWAPAGLDQQAQRVIRSLRRTWMKGGVGELQVALSGLGHATTFRSSANRLTSNLLQTLGPAGGARVWTSATPFVAPRFTKRSGKDTLEGQIRTELAWRGLPEAALIEILAPRHDLSLAFRHFVLHDQDKHRPPAPVAYAIRLEFTEPVEGPICLGYGSHAGLGRFNCD